MGMPRKRKCPRWTSEMFEIPAARPPKDPPEKRDCCKPKPKLAPLRVASAQQTVIEETITTADDTTIERISVSVTCTFEDTENVNSVEDAPVQEVPLGDTADDNTIERISVSVARASEETEDVSPIENTPVQEVPLEDTLTATNEPSAKRMKLSHEPEMETVAEKSPDFKAIWGSPKQLASPNSRRNKDMLWSLAW